MCAFALLVCALPLAALAEDNGTTQTIVLDVASKGSLGALITAACFWLNSQRKKASETPPPPPPPPQQPSDRNPPLGEDVARTYVTKNDMELCQGRCRKDIDDLRTKIDTNDEHAEKRSISTHRRIDEVLICQQKTNKGLGLLIGIMIGKGIAPTSMASSTIQDEG